MNVTPARVLWVAVAAGGLGLLASHWWGQHSPIVGSEAGQQALQAALEASAPPPPAGVTPARVGDPMPAIALPDLHGNVVDLATAFPQQPLLINVWASWCGPCIEEMPELQRFASHQGADGVQVIGLALDNADDVSAFLARVPVDYPILLDSPGPADASVWLGNAHGVLPYSVLIGRDGRIIKRKVGPFAHDELADWTAAAR
ncbi:TlpA family protein disulfide reductase [Pseudoxanthomonas dokdonensis]|uniref:Thioredoxin domain-containing protein n=1 Tax=Pseudoxanthomonas dokdonensis TaxID=344882 RepID=A0A0R0CP16_9GAMM|nr:TlpA disulfide reductase family protein [Pseudoxanthomonas dokdonensis]KRG71725.1 hypothetical protein ABB29_02105 [Pseudoxanthomonas dokdonensis]